MSAGSAAIILASASPRRRQLIAHLGIRIDVVPSDIPEDMETDVSPAETVTQLALRKASHVAQRKRFSIVLGADTVVECGGLMLNKPEDPSDAERMLRMLRGRSHRVHTGLAIVVPGCAPITSTTMSAVTMRSFSEDELAGYLATGESMDKAGAYGIQGKAGDIVESVTGCYTNVVGLPICAAARLAIAVGISITAPPPGCGFRTRDRCPCWPGRT